MSYNQHEPHSQSLFILTWRLYLSVGVSGVVTQHAADGVGGAAGAGLGSAGLGPVYL